MTTSTTLRVLHLDDESTILATTENYFGRFEDDIEIVTASEPADALERLETGAFDCLLCDYEMPQLDGLAVLDRLQTDGPDVPFVMYTGRGSENIASEAVSQGADDYVRKDEGMDHYAALAETIREAVERHDGATSGGRSPSQETDQTPAAGTGQPTGESDGRGSSAGVLSVDASGQVVDVDEEAASLLGQSRAQLRSAPLTAGQSGGPLDGVERSVRTAMDEGEPVGFSLDRDGTTVHGIATPDEDGVTVQFASEAADTTCQETVATANEPDREFAAGDQQLFAESLIDSLPDVFHAFDRDGRLRYWNEEATDVNGYSDEELAEMHAWDLVPEHDRDRIADVVQEVMETETPYQLESWYRTKSGREIPYEFTGAPVTTDEGDVIGMAGIGRDITERKAREDRLRKTKQRLAIALEATGTGVWEWNTETDDVIWNDSTHRLFGMEPGTFEGTYEAFTSHVHPDDVPVIEDALTQALEHGECYEPEFRIQRADGETVWMSARSKLVTEIGGTERMVGTITDITDRKRRERELRESQEKLRQIDENVDDVVWINTREQDGMQFVSTAYEDIWGRSVAELYEHPRSFVEGIHPDDRERVRDAIEQQQVDPDGYDETYRVVQPDGEVRWVRDRSSGVYDEDGNLERIVGIASDITDRREREQELEETRRQLDLALDETSTGAWMLDMQTDEITPYGKTTHLFGVDPTETANERYLANIHPDDRERVEETIGQAVDTRGRFETEFRIVDGDTVRWLKGRGKIVADDSGTPMEMLGVTTDITDRKQREKELAESEARFRAVFENAHDALVIANDEGEYVDANPAAGELFGVEHEELLGKTAADFAPSDFDFEAAWREFLTNDNQRGEFPLVRANGERRVAEFSATTNVRPGRHLSALRDVTDRRAREREIERQKERLELLASTISHDLRNPLRSAQSHMEMAHRECDTDLLDEIDRAHDRMAELIDDLLTLARQGEAVTETERVDVAAVASEAFQSTETRDATLSTESATVSADRTRLLQVFENLLVNAISHGREDATITVGPTDRGFFVADDGPGIPADEHEFVFEYGYSTAQTGTGFGLAIVSEIAEAHGWRVAVTESESGGARFEFET